MARRRLVTVLTGAMLGATALAACSSEPEGDPGSAQRTGTPTSSGSGGGPAPLAPVGEKVVVNGSFVSPLVERFGEVAIGSDSFVAGNTVLRADPDGRVCIGSGSNVQDNVALLALRGRPRQSAPGDCGPVSTTEGDETSIAHQASIVNSTIGRFAFVGFRAEVRNSVVEEGAFVLHGAVVEGVTIPRDRVVGIGQRVSAQAQADALPRLTEANVEFKREVLEVNREFAEGYAEIFESAGFDAVTGVSGQPVTPFNPTTVKPRIGTGVTVEPFARVIGDVRLGENSTVGRRTSIRADEGAPIVIGADARIEDRVTFHALKGTSIRVGDRLDTDDNVVFHGPLTVGERVVVEDDAVLFRSTVGDSVTVEERAIVVGVTLAPGVTVPEGAVITDQKQADALRR
jgi:carbon dioxide concentrating mechanism protein CcmM